MEQYISVLAFWCLAAAAVAVAILLVRQGQITARLRTRTRELEAELRIREAETQHLVSARLPALVDSLQGRPVEVPGPRHEQADPGFIQTHQLVIDMFTETTEKAIARGEQSAKATLKAMMRTVQGLTNEQQLAISNMQDRHDNPDVLEDLLKIDHMNSQLGRRAQATAVLCGSWPGQQRSASSLTDVVGGATSRIRDYLRVRVPAQADTAVISRAVEPVVLAVAELLDNGARYSQPNTSVEVNFSDAHNGIAIVIDDAGVGMSTEETQQAGKLLSGQAEVDINRLGDPPRIGFAVIGLLAARYGFTVSVDTRSPYGGVRAVVFLPTALLTRAARPKPVHGEPVTRSADAAEMDQQGRTASGLPMRRRRNQAPARATIQVAEREPDTAAAPTGPVTKTATGMGAWQRGTRSGRATNSTTDSAADSVADSATNTTSESEGSPNA